jgi:hypothetical protein
MMRTFSSSIPTRSRTTLGVQAAPAFKAMDLRFRTNEQFTLKKHMRLVLKAA